MRHGLVVAAFLAAGCASARSAVRASPLMGKPVEVRATDLDGHERRVNGDSGKVRVIDFWATWCDPCRDQLPFLEALRARYAARGLSVYAVSFDEDRAALERFLTETPLSLTVLWDKGGAVNAEPLEVTRLPTTLLVDRKGLVREVHLGFEREEEARLEAAVRRLLEE